MKRSCLLSVLDACLERVVEALRQAPSPRYALCGCGERADISGLDVTLVFDARGFTSEGDAALSRALVDACRQGVRRFIVANCRGQCFIGCGLGPTSHGVRIDVYGASCDYLASGIDSAEIRGARHGAGPGRPDHEGRPAGDHGDVGQAFMAGDP